MRLVDSRTNFPFSSLDNATRSVCALIHASTDSYGREDMKSNAIHFPCPNCGARIKAPLQLNGQRRNCPGCSHTFIVPRLIPEDAEPVLVLVEANDRLALGV